MATIPLDSASKQIAEKVRQLRSKNPGLSAWREIGREEQLRPENCETFILSGGRGSGKTRSGAEDTLERVRSGDITRVHVLAPTFADARDVCIEGESGIRACALPGEIANWNRSLGELYFTNGVLLKVFSAEEPGRLNGPQCGHLWVDEYWNVSILAIDMALLGLRIGKRITSGWTSTPKQTASTKYVHAFVDSVRRKMKMADNEANLAPQFVAKIKKKYEGTRLAKVEIEGEELEDVEGALWQSAWFERKGFRLSPCFVKVDGQPKCIAPKEIIKIVVAVDPSITDPELKENPHKDPDECGIVVAGVDKDSNGYVLGDFTDVLSPADWARLSAKVYSLSRANGIWAEKNQGGEMVRDTIKTAAGRTPIHLVHASLGKRARAEPVSLLYEQGRVKHCGPLDGLEAEMTSWDARDHNARSPNRIDALIIAFHALGLCQIPGLKTTSRLKTQETE